MFKKLRRQIEEIRWEDAANPSRWVRFVQHQVQLYFYILRELVRNRCPQQAAALTFTTLLSLVPLFAVAFSFFRGFAALEDVEGKAQDAIFSTLLAGPLLEQRGPQETREAAPLAQPAEAADLSAEEMLSEADARPRYAGVGATLALYSQALARGADAAQVREGMSTLRLAAVPSLSRQFSQMTVDALDAYCRAAGVRRAAPPLADEAPADAERSYSSGLTHLRRGEYARALDEFRLAESMGYPALKTREARAEVRAAMGDEATEGNDHATAAEHYRAALADYCDVIVLAGLAGSGNELGDLAGRHARILKKLGTALFELGKSKVEAYPSLQQSGAPNAGETLAAGVAELGEAAAVLQHSSEVHAWLARALWAAGQSDDARQQYEMAIEKSNEVAARGISMAVADYMRLFIDKVGRAEIGVLGILFLLVTATSLLSTIEKTFNLIWQVGQSRPFWIRFTSYCTLIWLGPVLIGASLWAREGLAGYMQAGLGNLPVLGHAVGILTTVGEHALPFLTTWLVLVALYKFLPHAHVGFTGSAWGAFLGALLLHGARPLFALYVLKAIRYEKIYGSLGAVPLFLLWLWLLWLIVLFGAEVAFTIQNVGLLRYRDKLHRLSSIFIDRYLAARIMMYVAREFWETGEPVTSGRLAEILQITPEEASDAAGRLVRLGLLTPVGEQRDEFHPARDLSKLRLIEVLSITDRFRDESRSVRPEDKPYEDKLEQVFRSAIESQGEALKEMTFHDLLREVEKDRSKWPSRAPSQQQ